MRKTIEDYLRDIEYLTLDDVNNTKWKIEDMHKIHPTLDEENYLTYILYIGLRDDLTEDEKTELIDIIERGKQEEKEEIIKSFSHFKEASY